MNRIRRWVASLLLPAVPVGALAAPNHCEFAADHFIFEADVVLFDDFDSDGHFRFLSVRIDADTFDPNAWVFARLWLSPDGEVWENYHTTEPFEIVGETGDDEFFVETELLEGYPTGFYDLEIELYDDDTGNFCDVFGPPESDDLALLPLEDATQDPEPVEVTVIDDGGGGAFSWIWLGALLAVGWRRREDGAGRCIVAFCPRAKRNNATSGTGRGYDAVLARFLS